MPLTRRNVLATGAAAGVAASLPGTAEAKLTDVVLQICPSCSANLAMGDVHAADCQAARITPPADGDIKPDAIKTAQAQRRSTESPDTPSRKKPIYGPPDPCPDHGCDRCKVQTSNKAKITCFYKNKEQCHFQQSC